MSLRRPANCAIRPVAMRLRLGGWSAAGAAVALVLAVAGCGSSGSPVASVGSGHQLIASAVLNTAKVERAIVRSSWAQRRTHVTVSCPAVVPQAKGIVFDCMAVYGASRTPFEVSELDGAGDVHYVAQ